VLLPPVRGSARPAMVLLMQMMLQLGSVSEVIGPSDIEVSRLRMSREPHLRNLAELREEHLESAALRAWRGRRRLALRLWTTLLPRAIGKMRQGEGAGASREDRGGSVGCCGSLE